MIDELIDRRSGRNVKKPFCFCFVLSWMSYLLAILLQPTVKN